MAVLKASDRKPEFLEEILHFPGGECIRQCYACGSCSMSCPIREVNDRFNPRRIIRMCLLGLKEQVLKSDFIWLCSSCFACQERCPQGVRITDLMTLLKNMAFRSGNIPEGVRVQEERIRESGRIYEISDFDNKKRLKMSLPELPTACDDVRILLEENAPESTGYA